MSDTYTISMLQRKTDQLNVLVYGYSPDALRSLFTGTNWKDKAFFHLSHVNGKTALVHSRNGSTGEWSITPPGTKREVFRYLEMFINGWKSHANWVSRTENGIIGY